MKLMNKIKRKGKRVTHQSGHDNLCRIGNELVF